MAIRSASWRRKGLFCLEMELVTFKLLMVLEALSCQQAGDQDCRAGNGGAVHKAGREAPGNLPDRRQVPGRH